MYLNSESWFNDELYHFHLSPVYPLTTYFSTYFKVN